MGRRIGTGGTSGVDYLDATLNIVSSKTWAVRTILVKPDFRPKLKTQILWLFVRKLRDRSDFPIAPSRVTHSPRLCRLRSYAHMRELPWSVHGA